MRESHVSPFFPSFLHFLPPVSHCHMTGRCVNVINPQITMRSGIMQRRVGLCYLWQDIHRLVSNFKDFKEALVCYMLLKVFMLHHSSRVACWLLRLNLNTRRALRECILHQGRWIHQASWNSTCSFLHNLADRPSNCTANIPPAGSRLGGLQKKLQTSQYISKTCTQEWCNTDQTLSYVCNMMKWVPASPDPVNKKKKYHEGAVRVPVSAQCI